MILQLIGYTLQKSKTYKNTVYKRNFVVVEYKQDKNKNKEQEQNQIMTKYDTLVEA